MDGVEKLYSYYEVLSEAKDKITEHEDQYLEILEAVKGTNNEKKLAAQFIPRFFKHFPKHGERALDALLDLCEDDDLAIRKQVIKDLPLFSKDSQDYLVKIADVLTQLLVADEPSELLMVQNSLFSLFKQDAKGTFAGIFSQILTGDEVARDRAIKFLSAKMKNIPRELLTKEVEEYVLNECRKVMQDVTGDEFALVMSFLTTLKVVKTIPGRQALVDMAVEQADLGNKFDASDSVSLPRLIHCIRQAMPLFCPFVSSGRFISYICLKVLKDLDAFQEEVDVGLELLKLLAEMCPHATKMEDLPECLEIIFRKLIDFLPLPPTDENGENSSVSLDSPNLHLSHVECLLYMLHQLGKRHPEFLAAPENQDKIKDFKLRLQYLARGIQVYIKKLREALQALKGDELKSEESKLKLVALRTTSNINNLIKDLFHVPPSYKSAITLSWKTPASISEAKQIKDSPVKEAIAEIVSIGNKRSARTPITFESSPANPVKKPHVTPAIRLEGNKGQREMYAPPGGKYSNKVKGFHVLQGRGGNRGFGRGRNNNDYYY